MIKKSHKINFLHKGIGYFPNLAGRLNHGFTWGPEYGNMSFKFGEKTDLKIKHKKFLDTLEMGKLRNCINIVSEHKDSIVNISDIGILDKTYMGYTVHADAVFTTLVNTPILMRPADCFTVIVSAQKSDGEALTGIIHSGWRSVLQYLPYKAARYLIEERGYSPANINFGVIPHISLKNRTYDHLEEFTDTDSISKKGYLTFDGEKYHLDESGYAFDQFIEAGILEQNTYEYNIDTYENAKGDGFYSNKYSTNTGAPEGRFLVATCLSTD